MPKISPLGQKLWPTGRGQTHTHTDRQTEKANTEDHFFRIFFLDFRFSFKGAVRYFEYILGICLKPLSDMTILTF